MNICPQCFLEFTADQTTCPDCAVALVTPEELSIEMSWPHCSKCQTIAQESDALCSNCGQSFYAIPFMPKLMPYLAAILIFFATAFTLDKMNFSDTALKLTGFVSAGIVLHLLRQRINMVDDLASVPWSQLTRKTKDALREGRKAN